MLNQLPAAATTVMKPHQRTGGLLFECPLVKSLALVTDLVILACKPTVCIFCSHLPLHTHTTSIPIPHIVLLSVHKNLISNVYVPTNNIKSFIFLC